MAIKFTEEEERILYAGMHFIWKGISLLDDVHSKVFDRLDLENAVEKQETKKLHEMILKVAETRARIDDKYIYVEDENEVERREKIEDEIYIWIEENVFNEELKAFLIKGK